MLGTVAGGVKDRGQELLNVVNCYIIARPSSSKLSSLPYGLAIRSRSFFKQ